MSPGHGEGRPGKDGPETPAKKSPQSTRNSADLARLARRHDFGVLVLAERRDGVVVTQVFASLDAAERKVCRTHERGLSASLTLVRLTPVPHLTPTDVGALDGES